MTQDVKFKWRTFYCDHCGEAFQSSRKDAKYCGAKCRKAASRRRAAEEAGELYTPSPRELASRAGEPPRASQIAPDMQADDTPARSANAAQIVADSAKSSSKPDHRKQKFQEKPGELFTIGERSNINTFVIQRNRAEINRLSARVGACTLEAWRASRRAANPAADDQQKFLNVALCRIYAELANDAMSRIRSAEGSNSLLLPSAGTEEAASAAAGAAQRAAHAERLTAQAAQLAADTAGIVETLSSRRDEAMNELSYGTNAAGRAHALAEMAAIADIFHKAGHAAEAAARRAVDKEGDIYAAVTSVQAALGEGRAEAAREAAERAAGHLAELIQAAAAVTAAALTMRSTARYPGDYNHARLVQKQAERAGARVIAAWNRAQLAINTTANPAGPRPDPEPVSHISRSGNQNGKSDTSQIAAAVPTLAEPSAAPEPPEPDPQPDPEPIQPDNEPEPEAMTIEKMQQTIETLTARIEKLEALVTADRRHTGIVQAEKTRTASSGAIMWKCVTLEDERVNIFTPNSKTAGNWHLFENTAWGKPLESMADQEVKFFDPAIPITITRRAWSQYWDIEAAGNTAAALASMENTSTRETNIMQALNWIANEAAGYSNQNYTAMQCAEDAAMKAFEYSKEAQSAAGTEAAATHARAAREYWHETEEQRVIAQEAARMAVHASERAARMTASISNNPEAKERAEAAHGYATEALDFLADVSKFADDARRYAEEAEQAAPEPAGVEEAE